MFISAGLSISSFYWDTRLSSIIFLPSFASISNNNASMQHCPRFTTKWHTFVGLRRLRIWCGMRDWHFGNILWRAWFTRLLSLTRDSSPTLVQARVQDRPFRRAVGTTPSVPSVSFVDGSGIGSVTAAKTRTSAERRWCVKQKTRSLSPNRHLLHFASCGISEVPSVVSERHAPSSTSAHSAEVARISPVPAIASEASGVSHLEGGAPGSLPLVGAAELRKCVVTPYHSSAFQSFIDRFPSLREKYPFIIHKLSTGFRLGDLLPLSSTFTTPNHPSASLYLTPVLEYLHSEVKAGHMSGPFTRTQLEGILGGPFRSSPIQVVVKFDAEGKLSKTQMAINLSYKGPTGVSVNDMINSDDFPTNWGSATEIESIVSPFTCLFFLSCIHMSVSCVICVFLYAWGIL